MAFNLDDYEPVAHRLDRWLKDCMIRKVAPQMLTDLVHYLSDTCVFKAELWENGVLIATGWAEERRGEGMVNKTSHVENCETGAVGRALANAGFAGSDINKRPSREEMAKVAYITGRQDYPVTTAKATTTSNGAGTLTVRGTQHGPLPEWVIAAAKEQGIVEVYDNRDSIEGTRRPAFKCTASGVGLWEPRTKIKQVKNNEPPEERYPDDEEPF